MNDELTAIPPARRRRMALMLAPVGVVLLVAGMLAVSLAGVWGKLAGLLIAVLAVLLIAVAWGLWRSVALSEAAAAERRLDEVLLAAAGAGCAPAGSGRATCATTGLACDSAGAGGCGASRLGRSG